MFISADNTKMADMVKDEDREQPQHWRYSDLLGEWDRKQKVLLSRGNNLNQKGFIKLIGYMMWWSRWKI